MQIASSLQSTNVGQKQCSQTPVGIKAGAHSSSMIVALADWLSEAIAAKIGITFSLQNTPQFFTLNFQKTMTANECGMLLQVFR